MNPNFLLLSSAVLLGAGAWFLLREKDTLAGTGADVWTQDNQAVEPEPDFNLIDWGESMTGMTETPADQMPILEFFEPAEFREWWYQMDTDLLIKLDAFRRSWGRPITISPHPDALGRNMGTSGSKSYHNVDRYGAVRAVDIFPAGLTQQNAEHAVQLAEQLGFGGIGIYTDTKPSMMMHLDNRATPGRWARVAGEYLGIENAYA